MNVAYWIHDIKEKLLKPENEFLFTYPAEGLQIIEDIIALLNTAETYPLRIADYLKKIDSKLNYDQKRFIANSIEVVVIELLAFSSHAPEPENSRGVFSFSVVIDWVEKYGSNDEFLISQKQVNKIKERLADSKVVEPLIDSTEVDGMNNSINKARFSRNIFYLVEQLGGELNKVKIAGLINYLLTGNEHCNDLQSIQNYLSSQNKQPNNIRVNREKEIIEKYLTTLNLIKEKK